VTSPLRPSGAAGTEGAPHGHRGPQFPPQPTPSAPTARALTDDPRHGPLPPLLLALTVVTGLVDAVSILRLGRVFVANMTGNIVFTGFAITGAPGFSLSASLFALAGFMAGLPSAAARTRPRADSRCRT
jgi:hypothetical protein